MKVIRDAKMTAILIGQQGGGRQIPGRKRSHIIRLVTTRSLAIREHDGVSANDKVVPRHALLSFRGLG